MKKQIFDSIYIMLGYACNFNCSYCLQGEKRLKVQQPIISKKFTDYLERYPNKKNTRLFFWGGEPLLYFETIKEIVSKYGKDFSIGIISNGSLLTQEIVYFINKYDIGFILSHDAHETEKTRHVDVLKNKRIAELFSQIKKSTINVTVSSISKPLKEIFEYYPLEQNINLNPMINTTDTEISRKYASFDEEKYRKSIQYLFSSFDEYIKGNIEKKREYTNVMKLLNSVNVFLEKGREVDRCYDCVYGAKTINMDCEGNLYVCHNSNIKIGTVDDSFEHISEKMKKIIAKVRTDCETCEINHVCGGHCVLLKDYGRKQKCEMSKVFYSEFLPWIKNHIEVLQK